MDGMKNVENTQLTYEQYKQFRDLLERRVARMPLQYIIGEWKFYGIPLKIKPPVCIPRPKSEEFVRLLLDKFDNIGPFTIFDVGCGCGALSLAVLNNMKNARCIALDCSHPATKLAEKNAKLLGLNDRFTVYHHTVKADNLVPKALNYMKCEYIISNPPYVKEEEIALLQPEVKLYENLKSIVGGQDGLRIARLLCDIAAKYLLTDGRLFMELGIDQPPLVQTIVNERYKDKLMYVNTYRDSNFEERFVEIAKL